MRHHHHHRHSHKEGKLTRAIENETAKLPSVFFLGAALGSMGVSLALHCMKRRKSALFVGQWAAPLLIMGLYDKVVKTNGND